MATTDHGLIAALYQSATIADWTGFLTALRAETRAGCAILTLSAEPLRSDAAVTPLPFAATQVWAVSDGTLQAPDGFVTQPDQAPASHEVAPGLAHLFSAGGPVMAQGLRAGRTYDQDEVLSISGQTDGSLRAALTTRGIRYLRMIRIQLGVPGQAAHSLWLCIGRTTRDFDAVHGVILSTLAPHLETAAPIYRHADAAQRRGQWQAQALGATGLGWVAFGARGQVIDMDAGATGVLAQVVGLSLQRGARPICADPDLSAALIRAVAAAGAGAVVPLPLSQVPPVQILLEPIRADGAHARGGATVLGLLRGPAQALPDAAALLSDLFGLTRSEARLALALAQGASIAQAADDLGLTIETARSYTKLIYAKLGVPGQGALIRQVLNSVAGLRLTP